MIFGILWTAQQFGQSPQRWRRLDEKKTSRSSDVIHIFKVMVTYKMAYSYTYSMLNACWVVEIIQHWIFAFADPLWPSVKVIETSMSRCAMPNLNTVRDKAIRVQVTHVSSLRRSCDLEWRARSSDWTNIIWTLLQAIFTANLMGIAWTVSEIIEHLLLSWLRSVALNGGQSQYN